MKPVTQTSTPCTECGLTSGEHLSFCTSTTHAADTPVAEHSAFKWGELTPWTEGDSTIAAEAGEPFGVTLLLQDIVDADDEVIARVEYLPCGSDEENAKARSVLSALNERAELIAALCKTTVVLEQLEAARSEPERLQQIMAQGYAGVAHVNARAVLDRVEKEK